jgi:hypothetical protein
MQRSRIYRSDSSIGGYDAEGTKRQGSAALSPSLSLRETQGKIFSGLAPYRKVVANQNLARDSPAEPKARQGTAREARKSSDRRLAIDPSVPSMLMIKLTISHRSVIW